MAKMRAAVLVDHESLPRCGCNGHKHAAAAGIGTDIGNGRWRQTDEPLPGGDNDGATVKVARQAAFVADDKGHGVGTRGGKGTGKGTGKGGGDGRHHDGGYALGVGGLGECGHSCFVTKVANFYETRGTPRPDSLWRGL